MNISIWRNASIAPSLFGIPCMAYFPIFIFLFHFAWWTLYTAVSIIVFFAILARFGLTFKVLWAKTLHLLRGKTIYARPWWYRQRFQDRH